jgi:hypothetical protein
MKALRLTEEEIVITIPTSTPAADAARYLKALRSLVKNSMLNEHLQSGEFEDCHAVLELLEHLHPTPDESDFKQAFSL